MYGSISLFVKSLRCKLSKSNCSFSFHCETALKSQLGNCIDNEVSSQFPHWLFIGVLMNTSINAVGFDLSEDQQALIEKKLDRVKYADDLIVDLAFKVKEDKKFTFDTTINFRWGASCHVSAEDYDFAAGLNKLMDVMDQKIKKEKDKIQQKG